MGNQMLLRFYYLQPKRNINEFSKNIKVHLNMCVCVSIYFRQLKL